MIARLSSAHAVRWGGEGEGRVWSSGAVRCEGAGPSAHEGVLRPEDDAADDAEEGDSEEAREEGREDPRQHDAGDAAREVLSAVRVGVLVPRDAGGALGGDGHADEAADAGVGGRDGHLELGGDEEPNADRACEAERGGVAPAGAAVRETGRACSTGGGRGRGWASGGAGRGGGRRGHAPTTQRLPYIRIAWSMYVCE